MKSLQATKKKKSSKIVSVKKSNFKKNIKSYKKSNNFFMIIFFNYIIKKYSSKHLIMMSDSIWQYRKFFKLNRLYHHFVGKKIIKNIIYILARYCDLDKYDFQLISYLSLIVNCSIPCFFIKTRYLKKHRVNTYENNSKEFNIVTKNNFFNFFPIIYNFYKESKKTYYSFSFAENINIDNETWKKSINQIITYIMSFIFVILKKHKIKNHKIDYISETIIRIIFCNILNFNKKHMFSKKLFYLFFFYKVDRNKLLIGKHNRVYYNEINLKIKFRLRKLAKKCNISKDDLDSLL